MTRQEASMSKSRLDEMHEENVRLGCRCWDPPRDPNEIGHLEECPALAHQRHKHLNERDTLKAERDRAVALLRELAEDTGACPRNGHTDEWTEAEAFTRHQNKARALLTEVDK